MFAVYNDQGLNFRSTLEGLYKVTSITPVKKVKPFTAHEEKENRKQQSFLSNEAINAYKKVINAKREEVIYHAYQIMKRPVTTIREDASISECYDLMIRKKFKQVPVIGDQGIPVGLITKESLLKVLLVDDTTIRHSEGGSIADLVSKPMLTAEPVSDIRRIAQAMYDYDLNCIPVANDADTIVGIITKTDIVYAVSTYPDITLWA